MKKFLGKKNVMIAFVAVAVLFVAVYVGMLVRPISYGFNYSYSKTDTVGGKEVTLTTKYNVLSDRVLRETNTREKEGEDKQTSVVDYWIYRDGENVYLIGFKDLVRLKGYDEDEAKEAEEEFEDMTMTKKTYKEKVELIKEAKEDGKAKYLVALGANTMGSFEVDGLFNIEIGDRDFKNTQAVVFTVVHGVVTVALLAFAALSVVFYVTKKK